MTAKKKITHIQLEPGAYPADADWQAMNATERGIYHSLIVYISCSNGKITNDRSTLSGLCNVERKVFDLFWDKFRMKFLRKKSHIEHRRVNKELTKARKNIRQKSLAGIASGIVRATAAQRLLDGSTHGCSTNKTKTNVSKDISTKSKIIRENFTTSLDLADRYDRKLEALFGLLTPREKTTFGRIKRFMLQQDFDTAEQILQYMMDAKQWADDNGKDSIAMKKCFVSKLNRHTDYGKRKGK